MSAVFSSPNSFINFSRNLKKPHPPWKDLDLRKKHNGIKNLPFNTINEEQNGKKPALLLVAPSSVPSKTISAAEKVLNIPAENQNIIQRDTVLEKKKNPKTYPMGYFGVKESAQKRKLDSLMGSSTTLKDVHKKEIQRKEQKISERPLTQVELWEKNRSSYKTLGSEHAAAAMKRDGNAWEDEDGYSKTREPPAFRDGYNNTLRVKPLPEAHLNNGLSSLPFRSANNYQPNSISAPLKGWTIAQSSRKMEQAAPAVANRASINESAGGSARSKDMVHRIVQNPDLSTAIGRYFLSGIRSGLYGLKSKNVNAIASLFKKENSTDALNGVGAEGQVFGKSEENATKDGSRVQGEIALLLRAIESLEAPHDYVKNPTIAESPLRQDAVSLSRALGNAFVSIGLTLPAGPRDDPKKNDSMALRLGSRLMGSVDLLGGSALSESLKSSHADAAILNNRKEVAIALGRAFMHLQNISAKSDIHAKIDSEVNDRTIANIGKLTLQILESTATRSTGKTLFSANLRKEVIAKAIGAALMNLEAINYGSKTSLYDSERDGKTENSSDRQHSVVGPVGPQRESKLRSLTRMNAPRELSWDREAAPSKILGTGTQGQNNLTIRMNKPHEIIVKRPILGGRDFAPPLLEQRTIKR